MKAQGGSRHQEEVLAALTELAAEVGTPADFGERVRRDRRSSFTYLGLRTPHRRRRVKQGFSFTGGTGAEVLAAWDDVWTTTNVGDVLFAPLDHYRARPIADLESFWPTVAGWIGRIDNWAHADDLARVYAQVLLGAPAMVYPTLLRWSTTEDQWARRISMVSLIRYTGKNATFMPIDDVLGLVGNCVADKRDNVAKALGWVLRETMEDDPQKVQAFLDEHAASMPAIARRRATERRT